MVMKRKSRNLSLNAPLRIWVLAGASSIALAALVVTFTARTVHADARLSRPGGTITAAPPVAAPTPDSLAAEQTAIKRGDRLHGIASWYGGVFHGRKTASGERYDMYAMTACHPTLPFGSLVRVVNKTNHRSVVVRITDRGNLVDEGRIIDLSFGAAKRLAMTKAGLAEVDLEVLSLGSSHGK
jgi:peptidoglycan lytic transglycosylase